MILWMEAQKQTHAMAALAAVTQLQTVRLLSMYPKYHPGMAGLDKAQHVDIVCVNELKTRVLDLHSFYKPLAKVVALQGANKCH